MWDCNVEVAVNDIYYEDIIISPTITSIQPCSSQLCIHVVKCLNFILQEKQKNTSDLLLYLIHLYFPFHEKLCCHNSTNISD